jgi:16S rRNA C1402 (ribose-2'-O) methylase RsmI
MFFFKNFKNQQQQQQTSSNSKTSKNAKFNCYKSYSKMEKRVRKPKMAEILHKQEIIYEREREREREGVAATAITNKRKWAKNKRKFGEKCGEVHVINNAHKSINKCCHYYIPNPRYPILFFSLFLTLL